MTEKGTFNREYKDRLRERFKNNSLNGFNNHEIIEFILTFAMPRSDVRAVAKKLVRKFKSIRGVLDAAPDELGAVEGVGENAVILIKLLKEVGALYLKERIMGKDVLRSKKDVLDYLNLYLSGERVEKFLSIYLNSKNEVLAIETLHEGTINQTVVYPRKVIERAFKHNAHSVIFVHNHPSGDPSPSNVDWQLTGVLDRATRAVDLIIHDHIIIGRDKHFSARESGWLGGGARPLTRAADFHKVFGKKP
ncbi:MAG: DNA repair protein RadC [Thermodesulfobacteriota bacterium]|nr:MAG: DNA repair protein RadC [Thermodesulfobacteriota bacterium]